MEVRLDLGGEWRIRARDYRMTIADEAMPRGGRSLSKALCSAFVDRSKEA